MFLRISHTVISHFVFTFTPNRRLENLVRSSILFGKWSLWLQRSLPPGVHTNLFGAKSWPPLSFGCVKYSHVSRGLGQLFSPWHPQISLLYLAIRYVHRPFVYSRQTSNCCYQAIRGLLYYFIFFALMTEYNYAFQNYESTKSVAFFKKHWREPTTLKAPCSISKLYTDRLPR